QLLFVHALSAPADGRMPPSPPTGCAIRCVGSTGLAVLAANRSTAPADSDVRFSGNGSWAYVWSWNNASNTSRGGTYTAVSAAEDASLFSLRSEEHTSELQSRFDLVCRLLLEKK